MHKRLSIASAALLFVLAAGVVAGAGEKKPVIGFNNPLKGLYSVDILEKSFVAACNALGVEPLTFNDEGRLENAVTNLDIDCIYATNGDIGSVVIEALSKHPNITVKVLVTDLGPAVLTGLESSKVAAANGAHWINTDFAVAFLVNALRGNELREADGAPPRLIVPVITLPSRYVGMYGEHWIQNHPFFDDEIRAMVGPGVTLDTLLEIIADYGIESRLEAKGVLTR